MIAAMKRLLAAPAFDGDEARTRTARLLNVVIISLFLTMAAAALSGLIVFRQFDIRPAAALFLCFLLAAIHAAMRRGHVRGASIILVLTFWCAVTAAVFAFGGVRVPPLGSYILITLIAGLLLGVRSGVIVAVLSIVSGIGSFGAETYGLIRFSATDFPPAVVICLHTGLLTITAVLLNLYVRQIDDAMEYSLRSEQALADANLQLEREIAEHEQSQRALNKSEERYQRLVQNIPVGLFRNAPGPGGRLTMTNPAAARLFGRETVDETIGVKLADYCEDPEERQAFSEKLLVNGSVQGEELRLRREDGTTIWVAVTAQAIRDESGQIRYFDGMIEDITDRKQTEETLRASEQRYHTLFEAAGDAILAGVPDGQILRFADCNSRTTLMFGASRNEIIGKTPLDFSPPTQPDGQPSAGKIAPVVRAVLDGVPQSLEWQHCRADGTVFDTEVTLNRIDWAGQPHVMGVVRDITERKQAESRLRLLSSAVEQSTEGLAVADMEGRLLFVNPAFARMHGYEPDELVDEHLAIFHAPEQMSAVDAANAQIREAGEFKGEIGHVRRDGTIFPGTMHNALIRDAAGQPAGFIGTLRDITEQKQAEEEREELLADLEAKNSELERFTYTVSHDLKAPLITIAGFLNLLKQDLDAQNAPRIREDLASIKDATKTMQRLLQELLDLSRVGRKANPPENVALADLAREVVALACGTVAERAVKVDISPDLPVVSGDRARLWELLQNLIENAVRFLGDQPEPRIEIGVRRRGDETVCYVRDNGIGIAKHYQDQVFGLFEKLDANTDGTGVGLALVKRIVEVHGGRVWVESKGEGHGSTFCFTILADRIVDA